MKKNKKIKTGLIIGPSGIGKVHVREFLNYGMVKVGLFGRIYKKNRIEKLNFDRIESKKLFNLKNFSELKKFNPNVISICSPTHLHLYHILKFQKICKKILIEKPLLWKKNFDNILESKKILKKINKLIVNLPMINLADQIITKEKIKKTKNIDFTYKTKGKSVYNEIPIDLLPHALSFSFQFIKKDKFKYKIIKVHRKKNKWSCEININECMCRYFFHQDKKRKFSNLSFKINKNLYSRTQVKKRNNYLNRIIKNKKKVINIKNPMVEFIRKSLNNFDNKRFVMVNKKIVQLSTKIASDLISYKNV